MDGIHDMGGVDNFGPVRREDDEPVFHSTWEGRVLAIERALKYTKAWESDVLRSVHESLPPDVYITHSYYQRRMLAVEATLVGHGMVDEDELRRGHSLRPALAVARVLEPEHAERFLMSRDLFEGRASGPPAWSPGQLVRVRNLHRPTHTRLPRYLRGHVGEVDRAHGAFPFPDSVALGIDDPPQWLYAVTFAGTEVWGADAEPGLTLAADAFESYLEPA